ncbi:Fungal Zn(2)-Cys(6) binuclear cluster domain [Geosmithia morbida]|uniref:Fungal Zn(2)-Cys(6) binuclear cluster domain n=1 Tax=Geosmithia morbida TaxID=1094350 RepID=A0A9P5D1A0_9HYPO|nr:Fungal Zn(2)-Cys(6) binuclear cluster domain [Geosmithia morbida]KAF4122522.1 Fungal Zn(2)-Cys(6) binuclear cluster domain [Geosmithia morbida]
MPPRRSHKKSRAGCRRCKIRKIKCDEVHPRCGNCHRHGVVCDFESTDAADELATIPTPAAGPTSPMPPPTPSPMAATPTTTTTTTTTTLHLPHDILNGSSSGGSNGGNGSTNGHGFDHGQGRNHHSHHHPSRSSPMPPPPAHLPPPPRLPPASSLPGQVDRLMELRLMHQYTYVTSKTLLTNSPLADDIWQRAVPQMAFAGRTYLADAVLSVAALHLRSQSPDDKALVHASHAYTASTLAEYCASLDRGITSDNAEALFLTASLIAFQSVASRIFAKDDAEADPDDPNARYALPLPWFHAFQGVKTVVASSWPWIRTSSIVKTVIDSQPSLQLDLDPLGPGSFFGHLLDGIAEELAREEPHLVQATTQCYSHAVCVLNWAHKSAHPAATLAFPATVARRFIELVELKRPRALAIIACFFALLKRLDSVWWLHDVSKREVMGLVGLFEPGSKWWRHLEWPVRIALWDGGGDDIPPDVWGVDWDQLDHQGIPHNCGDGHGFVNHIELVAELMGQSTNDLLSVATPFTGEPPLTAESPD